LLLSLSCLVCFNSFLFFLKSSHFTFLESGPEDKNKHIFHTRFKICSPDSSPSWIFLFCANFSDCCLFLNCLTLALPGLNCPFTNLFEMDLGFPSSSLLL
ncbi:hypothetical protein N320_10157, partial [Buceros rhinoceros silvestris]